MCKSYSIINTIQSKYSVKCVHYNLIEAQTIFNGVSLYMSTIICDIESLLEYNIFLIKLSTHEIET